MAKTTIKLSQRYELHGETFDEIVLREPTGADYWQVGKPADWQPISGGRVVWVENLEALKSYADRLPVGLPAGAADMLNLADTIRLERAILDFFTAAARSTTPATSSSGAPDTGSAMSAASPSPTSSGSPSAS